jgi:O-antigen ligase
LGATPADSELIETRVISRSLTRALLLATVAWSALAFGAVYRWGYVPVIAASVVVTVLTVRAWPRAFTGDGRLFAITAGILVLAIAVQIVSLPTSVLGAISPETPRALSKLDLAFGLGSDLSHPLSLFPAATMRALMFLTAFFALSVSTAALLATEGSRRLVLGIAVFGAILGLIGIIQKNVADLAYGFWADGGRPFGPFLNRNHFAGWMMMAFPVAAGGFFAALASSSSRGRSGVRDRILWFGSAGGGEAVVLAVSAAVMALAMALSHTRSGIAALCGATALLGAAAGRRRGGIVGGLFVGAVGTAIAIGCIVWAGFDAIALRFEQMGASRLAGRVDAWHDAWDLWRQFPLTGVGVNAYNRAMTIYQQRDLAYHANAAHNDYLQVLAEGGVLVAIPAAVLLILLVRRAVAAVYGASVSPSEWWLRIGALGGLTAIGCQEFFDFSLQIPANAVLFAMVLAIAVHPPALRRTVHTC